MRCWTILLDSERSRLLLGLVWFGCGCGCGSCEWFVETRTRTDTTRVWQLDLEMQVRTEKRNETEEGLEESMQARRKDRVEQLNRRRLPQTDRLDGEVTAAARTRKVPDGDACAPCPGWEALALRQ